MFPLVDDEWAKLSPVSRMADLSRLLLRAPYRSPAKRLHVFESAVRDQVSENVQLFSPLVGCLIRGGVVWWNVPCVSRLAIVTGRPFLFWVDFP